MAYKLFYMSSEVDYVAH